MPQVEAAGLLKSYNAIRPILRRMLLPARSVPPLIPARHPNLVRFLKAMHARPSFAACIEEERKMLTPLGLKYAA